jgi:ABC-type polysaccharide/polyol phosphate transport system ATPase subunit
MHCFLLGRRNVAAKGVRLSCSSSSGALIGRWQSSLRFCRRSNQAHILQPGRLLAEPTPGRGSSLANQLHKLSMTQEWRRQAPLVELAHVTKWGASSLSTDKRYHRNEALQSLIELLVVIGQANRYGQGTSFDDRVEVLLDDVSVSIPRGCVVGIVDIGGQSKAAFLNVVGNVEPPNRGEVRLFGRSGSLAQVDLFARPHATCRNNLASSARIAGMPDADIRAALDRIQSFSGLGQYLDVPQRRVPKWVASDLSISMLCCLDLDLLIIDEVDCPVSDKVGRSWNEYLRRAPDMGKTMLIGSRRIKNVFDFSTHLLLIENSRVLALGPTQEVRKRHATFLQTSAETPIKTRQLEIADSGEDDDDEDDEIDQGYERDAVINNERGSPSYTASEEVESVQQWSRKDRVRVRLDFERARFLQSAKARSEHTPPTASARPAAPAPELCRIVPPAKEGTENRDDGSQMALLSTTDHMSNKSSKPSFRCGLGARVIIPVETLVPNLRLRPELELLRSKANGPLLRIRADRDILVSKPSRVVLEALIPPQRLATQRYTVRVVLGVGDSGDGAPRVLFMHDGPKFRVVGDEDHNRTDSGCDLHGSGVWWLKRAGDLDESDGFWLCFPGSDRAEVAVTEEGIPIVDHSEQLQFSTSLRVEEEGSEISAWLKLTTPAGHAICYDMAPPERISEPGPYRISVIVPGKELGSSLFRVTMMILIKAKSGAVPEQVPSEGCIAVERSSGREAGREELTGGPSAMELEQRWSVR